MSVDDTIRTSLERLIQPVADPGAVVAEVDRRRERNRHRRTGARVLIAVVCLGVLGVGALLADMSGSGNMRAHQPSSTSEASSGWLPDDSAVVTVATSGLGMLQVTTSEVRASEEGWLEHTVTIENTGPETVYLNDLRTGELLGDRELLATTDGCGYAARATGEPVEVACHRNYEPLVIEPGDRWAFTVTLRRGLDGMHPVTSATFVFRIPISQSHTAFSHPLQSGTPGELFLTYSRPDA